MITSSNMLPSPYVHHTRRGTQRLRRDDSTQCATCPSLKACPTCPEGHMCQLSIPASCSECPVNTCVADPAYRQKKSGTSKIEGALGGLVVCFAIIALFYWLHRQRKQKAKEAQRSMREAAKVRLAEGEKFRPGDAKSRLDSRQASKDTSINPFKDDSSQYKGTADDDNDDDDGADEDTEWTELREDGLTTYRKPPNGLGVIEPDSASAKRRSIGAATHLSRITEGAEEEEEDRQMRYQAGMQEKIIEEEEEEPLSITSRKERGRTSNKSMRSEGDERSVRYSRQSDPFNTCNPFADGSDAGSLISRRSYGAQRASSILLGAESGNPDGSDGLDFVTNQRPSPAHRATGAPLVDLHGKEKADVRSFRKSQLESPLDSLVRKPSLPARKSDLALLLNDAAIPKSEARPSSIQSPESGLVFRRSDLLSPYVQDGHQSRPQDFPADELLNSNVYKQSRADQGDGLFESNRLSTATASSAGSYVMSSPKIITPGDQGVQRLQLQQGKAQLIRVTGLQSNAEKDAKERGMSCRARVRNPQSADLSILEFQSAIGSDDGEDEDENLPYLSEPPTSARSERHSNVPEEVEHEREDEVEIGQGESGTHRTGNFTEFDEVRLQYELAQYPFKEADSRDV
jgi:hypothetical protein